jgi:hypothetical protein
LRRLQREQPPSPYVFTSERGGPIAPKSFHTLIMRLGERGRPDLPMSAVVVGRAALAWNQAHE